MKRVRNSFQLILILFCASVVNAQTAVTSVHGTVFDQSGAEIPNGHVSISDVATGFKSERLTDERGEYAFQQINPGRYTILVSVAAFANQERIVELLVNQTTRGRF